jgi:hypothetical protein
MLLHDSLDDAVADVYADLPTLVGASRRRGLAIRRRRRALASVGATAAAAVLAVGAYALVPGSADPDRVIATDQPAPVEGGPLSGRTAPITGRGAVAALAAAVEDVADGTFGGFQGDAYPHESFAAFRFLPATGSGPAGLVMVNLQPLGVAGGAPYTCDQPELIDCRVTQLPNGDTVRTYRDNDSEMGIGSERLAAEVISPDRKLRIVVGALNTNPYADGAMRAVPVLTTEQLVEVATQPWWSRTRLPEEFVTAGEGLDDFRDATTQS